MEAKSVGKPRITVGILGAGGIVKDVHLSVLYAMPNVEVLWLCDKVESQARQLSQLHAHHPQVFTHIEDCPDVDIVLVAIPVGVRREALNHIFRRGWNVLCEKPFAVSLTEHDALVAQAAESGVQIGVGLMRRYYRGSLLARQIIASGVLGEIREVWASQGARLTRTGRRDWYQGDRAAAGGGILMETGSHLVDQVFTVLNVDNFQLQDCIQQTVNGLDVETKAVARLATAAHSGIPCTVALSNTRDLYSGIDIRFDSAVLKLSATLAPPTLCTHTGQQLATLNGEEGAERSYQAFYLEWKDFMHQCQSGGTHRAAISAETARQSTAFIDECYRFGNSQSPQWSFARA